VDVTGTDIRGLQLQRSNLSWFVLPSEIINNKHVCDIIIEEKVIDLFTTVPQLSLLTNTETNKPFVLPDVVYTGGCDYKTAQFRSIFGVSKKKEYEQLRAYYYFNRDMKDVKQEQTDEKSAINRYALFMEGKIHIETNKSLSLIDTVIDNLYPEPCIIIGYSGDHLQVPDVLVREFENFYPLSYHVITKQTHQKSVSII
jgi:hypothetical protein